MRSYAGSFFIQKARDSFSMCIIVLAQGLVSVIASVGKRQFNVCQLRLDDHRCARLTKPLAHGRDHEAFVHTYFSSHKFCLQCQQALNDEDTARPSQVCI
jgi:hypothetical protein